MKLSQQDIFYAIQLGIVVLATYWIYLQQYGVVTTITAIYGALITMKLVSIEDLLIRYMESKK